jgi:hypothetical protein
VIRNVKLVWDATGVSTDGLNYFGQDDIHVVVPERSMSEEVEAFLRFVVGYLAESNRKIRDHETIAYGYWLVQFRQEQPRLLEAWEYTADATDFQRGVRLSLTYWRDQHRICDKLGVAFDPPRADRLTVVSKGVFEGLPVKGVRYPAPEHMSGWWFVTDEYDGQISSLGKEHTYHVTAARSDLAKFLALPVGCRFDLTRFEDVWFDRTVLSER